MNKLKILTGMVFGMFLIVSCESDRDSNPTLHTPASFVLNTPPYAASGVFDLKTAGTIELTCSQPDYGFTAATTYSVQLSTSGVFNDASGDAPATYVTLQTIYSTAKIEVSASEMAVAIVGLFEVTEEENFPQEAFPLHIRLKSALTGNTGVVYSNAIELKQVLSYFALDPMTFPEYMYLIGSINGWDWAKSYSMVPVHSNDGKFWRVQYFPAESEIKFNMIKDWDGGDFGYAEDRFPDASIAYAGIEDAGGNIKINNAGWYIVVVTTELEGRNYNYTVEFLPPDVYLIGDVTGGWDIKEQNLFTVPADGEGEFVSPAFGASAELRMCIKLDEIDWWKTEFVFFDGIITYRGAGGDQDRVEVSAGQKAYLNFTEGSGTVK